MDETEIDHINWRFERLFQRLNEVGQQPAKLADGRANISARAEYDHIKVRIFDLFREAWNAGCRFKKEDL